MTDLVVDPRVAVTTGQPDAVATAETPKTAVVEPVATVTLTGATTEALLLERATTVPAGAALESVMVQATVEPIVSEVVAQLIEESVTEPAVRPMEAVLETLL
jgi:hypothetical protein